MLDRRGFLKFVGGAGVGILATPFVWKSTDDVSIWSQNWPWVPDPEGGEPGYVSTISKCCPSGQGIRVRLLGNRPVRVHGDPEHPLSLGGLTALAAAEVQLLHSPARLRQPHKRNAGGSHDPITWEEAGKLLAEGLNLARSSGIFALSGDATTSVNSVLSILCAKTGGQCFIMPGEEQPARRAWKAVCGLDPAAPAGADIGRLGYDVANSDMVLAIGAGFLESWGTVVRNRKAWSAGRPTGSDPAFRLAYAGPVQDSTAAGADWWLPMRAGHELPVALGIARLIYRARGGADLEDAAAFAALLDAWTPVNVEQVTGIPAQMLEAVADALLSARRPLVVVGSPLNQGGGAAPIIAGIACNLLLGNLNAEGGLRILPHLSPAIAGSQTLDELLDLDVMAFAEGLDNGTGPAVGAFIFYEANPIYALPGSLRPLFTRAGFTVAFTNFMDETARQCDLILPAAMGLERYDDAETPYGAGELIYSLAVPVAAPLFEARSAGDVLLAQAREMGFVSGGFMEMVDVLRARAASLSADWVGLSNGVPFTSRRVLQPGRLTFGAAVLDAAVRALPDAQTTVLAPVVRLGVGTAETGIPPYGVKLVGPTDVYRNTSIVHINSATAEALGLDESSAVTLTGPLGDTCPALVLINEAVSTGSVAMLGGMGHTAFDAFSQNKGSNLLQLAAAAPEPGTELSVWSTIPVKVAKA